MVWTALVEAALLPPQEAVSMILRTTVAALALAVGLSAPALAAPDAEETAILAQVNRLFAAMKAQDKTTLDSLI